MAIHTAFKASVTQEYDVQPPQTLRTTIVAVTAQKAASRAVQAIRKQYPGTRPSSIVVVLEFGDRTEVKGKGRKGAFAA